jgi:hypothetical protein
MGADVIVGRDELVSKAAGGALPEFNYVLCTTNAESYLSLFPKIIAPLGTLGLIDDPRNFDVVDFKRKGITTAWELIFTKTLYKRGIETQGAILDKISQLVDSGEIVSTLKTIYEGLSPETLEKVHRQQQTGSVIGKLGITYE